MRKLDESPIYYVYVWYRLDKNEPFYVGKGKGNRDISIKSRNKHFLDLYKYLIKNNIGYSVIHLKDNLTEEEAFNLEIDTIKKYRELGYKLVNIMDGGEGGDYVSTLNDEQKLEYSRKMSQSCKGKNLGHRHTEESKQKMREKASKRVGELNPFYGKHHSEETKQILREKLSGSKIGALSEDAKNKLSTANKKSFCVLYSDNKKEVYNSRTEAVEILSKKYDRFNDGVFRKFILQKNKITIKVEVEPNYYIIGIFCLKNKKGESLIKLNNIKFNGNLDDLKLYGKAKRRKIKVIFKDNTEMMFNSVVDCEKYLHENYQVSSFTVDKLLKSGEPLNSRPCYYNLYKLNGMRIEEVA